LRLNRYQQQPEDLAEQLPRLERLLVWLHHARPLLKLPEVDRLYGELLKLEELARQPVSAEQLAARVRQAHTVATLRAWKQLTR
jgi:inorganic triphosphatase YgiF